MARRQPNSNTERQKRWRTTDKGRENRALMARRRRLKQRLVNAHVLAGTPLKCTACRFESRNPLHFHASLEQQALVCATCRIDLAHGASGD